MDANGRGRMARVVGRAILGLAAAWLVPPVATVEASAMRSGPPRGRPMAQAAGWGGYATPLPGRWGAFLAGGPATWTSRQSPPFTAPARLALLSLVQGDPAVAATSPLVEDFVWRRSLNPARFDRYHPCLGPRLPQGFVPPTPPPLVPPVVPPTVPQLPLPPDPPLGPPIPSVPPTVPEPSALLVIVAGVAGALVLRRRAKPSAA